MLDLSTYLVRERCLGDRQVLSQTLLLLLSECHQYRKKFVRVEHCTELHHLLLLLCCHRAVTNELQSAAPLLKTLQECGRKKNSHLAQQTQTNTAVESSTLQSAVKALHILWATTAPSVNT